jgi:hypothetical protein
LIAVALLLVGCGQVFGPARVDGLPIGDKAPCGAGECDREIAFARGWLDAASPGHAPIRSVSVHLPDFRDDAGNHILMARSGGRTVVAVLRLEDGSIRAVLLGCGLGIEPDRCGLVDAPRGAR